MTSAKVHLVYLYLLTTCLRLEDMDAVAIKRVWGLSREDADELMIRSVPDRTLKALALDALVEMFDYDLRGVPGFYYSRGFSTRDILAQMCGLAPDEPTVRWQLNIPFEKGILKPYLDERGRISGIFIYRHVHDQSIGLLSSQGLIFGTPANKPNSYAQGSLAA